MLREMHKKHNSWQACSSTFWIRGLPPGAGKPQPGLCMASRPREGLRWRPSQQLAVRRCWGWQPSPVRSGQCGWNVAGEGQCGGPREVDGVRDFDMDVNPFTTTQRKTENVSIPSKGSFPDDSVFSRCSHRSTPVTTS